MRREEQVSGMLCPICQSGLTLSDRGGLEIDYCSSCGCVRLDRGEPEKIMKRNAPSGGPVGIGLVAEPHGLSSQWLRDRSDIFDVLA